LYIALSIYRTRIDYEIHLQYLYYIIYRYMYVHHKSFYSNDQFLFLGNFAYEHQHLVILIWILFINRIN
jgi:hypothetical protein